MQFLRRQLEKNANKIHTTWNMQKAFKNVRNKHRVVLIVWKYLIGKTESESVCCSSEKLDWKLNAIQCFAKHSILHQWWIGCFLMCWPPSNGRASNWPTHTHTRRTCCFCFAIKSNILLVEWFCSIFYNSALETENVKWCKKKPYEVVMAGNGEYAFDRFSS